ncbi:MULTISPECIES: hypothetical protein [Brucella]|uniref:hypothetical protein n=1 Tax=Brucella TaxID=234 RepID=UPI0002CEE201|nr:MULTISPECIES: hypothetical protein [Brucella]AOG53982.1 hypothetical protein BFS11_10855 [Brucella melitensis]ENR00357.1 hypothetical protein C046_03122 [Brucella melitensis UK22/06]ENS64494.1 hypothetical protein C003_02114 [Brucella melitensis F9/05]ENS91018.1 hypothetical protein C033_02732 [Brucella melitensis UK37/05]ERT93806.1 hypothetical protein P040_00833 [Brucella melitensis 11-1823-3434]
MTGKLAQILGIEMFQEPCRRRTPDGDQYRGCLLRAGQGVDNTVARPGGAGFGEDVLLGVAHVRNAPVTCR